MVASPMGAEEKLPVNDEAEPQGLDLRTQRGMEVDPTRYYETGRVGMGIGADGMPVVAGSPPSGPEPGLTEDSLVCRKALDRPQCIHYLSLITPAEGEAKGAGRELRQIRRFCRFLATAAELFEITGNIYACSARSPQDPRSEKLIDDFEAEQLRIAAEGAEKSGELEF